jgi:LmbE family N-acetylglucosaminyl deacetylase
VERRKPKSSPTARALIDAALKRYRTERAAARALGLPNHGQLNKMKRGLIRDTPSMQAAIRRARKRARRAFYFVPPQTEVGPAVDADELRRQIKNLLALLPPA